MKCKFITSNRLHLREFDNVTCRWYELLYLKDDLVEGVHQIQRFKDFIDHLFVGSFRKRSAPNAI